MHPQTAAYLAELPEVKTSRLPEGALFWAEGAIYEVSEVDARGYQKARLWRHAEHREVALVPGSLLSRHLPVIERGRVLPVYRSQHDLLEDGNCSCFVFPSETLALDAAYLDSILIQRRGPYVRQQEALPAFALTDGIHLFRLSTSVSQRGAARLISQVCSTEAPGSARAPTPKGRASGACCQAGPNRPARWIPRSSLYHRSHSTPPSRPTTSLADQDSLQRTQQRPD